MLNTIEDINIRSIDPLITPKQLKINIPRTSEAESTIIAGREAIGNIINGKDARLLTVIGPCSIHSAELAIDYAKRLKELAERVKETHLIAMRIYFEKPRTSTGWKGLINDPHLNGSFEIEEGLYIARQLLIDIAKLGLPAATEALDPILPQYFHDLISWSAIGARTSESQTHREMSSGLSSPIGFKNATDGGLSAAINALKSVSTPHSFLGIDNRGRVSTVHSEGNLNAHLVLRGGDNSPNYDKESIDKAVAHLKGQGVNPLIMVDCSHANSNKDHCLQPLVFTNVINQKVEGNQHIIGVMIESNINAGRQDIPTNLADLKYGVSLTDACIDWPTTEKILLQAHQSLSQI